MAGSRHRARNVHEIVERDEAAPACNPLRQAILYP